MKTIILVLSALELMAQNKPAPKLISAEYITLGNALGVQQQQLNEAQSKITAAAKLLEYQICKGAGIEPAVCAVDWQAGTVGRKPPEKTTKKK